MPAKLASIIIRSRQFQIAALCDSQITRDGKPQTRPAALFAAKRKKQVIPVFLRNAGPVIGNIDHGKLAGALDINAQPLRPGRDGVTDKIQQNA